MINQNDHDTGENDNDDDDYMTSMSSADDDELLNYYGDDDNNNSIEYIINVFMQTRDMIDQLINNLTQQ